MSWRHEQPPTSPEAHPGVPTRGGVSAAASPASPHRAEADPSQPIPGWAPRPPQPSPPPSRILGRPDLTGAPFPPCPRHRWPCVELRAAMAGEVSAPGVGLCRGLNLGCRHGGAGPGAVPHQEATPWPAGAPTAGHSLVARPHPHHSRPTTTNSLRRPATRCPAPVPHTRPRQQLITAAIPQPAQQLTIHSRQPIRSTLATQSAATQHKQHESELRKMQ
jgi:hypothetical protein